MGNLLGYFNEEVGKLPAYFEHHFTFTLISNFHVGDYPQHSDWGKQCFIRPNGIPNSEGDPKLHLKWRSDEAIILHTKMFFCTGQSLRVWRVIYRSQGPYQRLESEHVLWMPRLWPGGKRSNHTFERSMWWTQLQSVSEIKLVLIPLLCCPPSLIKM